MDKWLGAVGQEKHYFSQGFLIHVWKRKKKKPSGVGFGTVVRCVLCCMVLGMVGSLIVLLYFGELGIAQEKGKIGLALMEIEGWKWAEEIANLLQYKLSIEFTTLAKLSLIVDSALNKI